MQVKAILNARGKGVITVPPSTTIGTLARRLRLENIGAVVVSQDGASVDGIISERDVLRGLAEYGTELLVMSVHALMTRGVRLAPRGMPKTPPVFAIARRPIFKASGIWPGSSWACFATAVKRRSSILRWTMRSRVLSRGSQR